MGYQYIVIDCPAGIDIGFINAITPANEAIVVTTPEITAIRDADRVTGLLEANNIFNVKLLLNRVRLEIIQRNDIISVDDVQEILGIPLLGAVPEDSNVIVATRVTLPISKNRNINKSLGLRHKAGIGITEESDAISIVISEETGKLSYIKNGKICNYKNDKELRDLISNDLL